MILINNERSLSRFCSNMIFFSRIIFLNFHTKVEKLTWFMEHFNPLVYARKTIFNPLMSHVLRAIFDPLFIWLITIFCSTYAKNLKNASVESGSKISFPNITWTKSWVNLCGSKIGILLDFLTPFWPKNDPPEENYFWNCWAGKLFSVERVN